MSEGKCRLSALVIRFFSLNGGEPATAGAAVPTKLDPCVQVLVLGDRQQDQGAHYEHCTRPVSKHCTRVQTLHPCPNTAPESKHCTRVQTLHLCPNTSTSRLANTSTHLGLGAGAPLFSDHTWKGVGGWVEGGGCVCQQRMGLFDDVQSVG